MYKHYIRTNEAGEVVAAFSDAFREPEDGDILVAEIDERHFNPDLIRDGIYRYLWDGGKMIERSEVEIESIAEPVRRRAETLVRLAELDRIIPRCVEDLYLAVGKTPYAAVQAAVDEKIELRSRL